jgi:hypothetical protein
VIKHHIRYRKAVHSMKWFRVTGAMMLLAMTLAVYGGTAAAAPVSKPGTNNPAVVDTFAHTFTVQRNGAAVIETCTSTSIILTPPWDDTGRLAL